MLNTVLNEETGELIEYRHIMKIPMYLELYCKFYSKELGRLDQVLPRIFNGTNTILFINKADVPAERCKYVMYGRVVVRYRPEKGDLYRTQLTVGGSLIIYPSDCNTQTVNLLTVNLLINSFISTPDAKFMTIDTKSFYLNTLMKRFEYMKLKLNKLPKDIIKEYDLAPKIDQNGYVYVDIRRGMYGLPQAGLLFQKLLETRLNAKGYSQNTLVPGLRTHTWRPITFTLCVVDFWG